VSGDGSVNYLTETALRAIPTQPNFYMDEQASASLVVQVFDRGLPAAAGTPVAMFGAPSTTAFTAATTGPGGGCAFPYTAPADGSIEVFIFVPGANPQPPAQVITQTTTYMTVRALPLDDDIGQLEPNFENVYRNVLAKWHALAPCMDNWLRLDDEEQVRAYAPVLLRLTAPESFESFRYMPVTRDMTQGERTLLYAFLGEEKGAQPAAEAAPEGRTAAEHESLGAAAGGGRVDYHALSRKLRNH
jgi:hypothetical protein